MSLDSHDAELRRLIGLADCFELLCAAFSFPTAELARALVDGRLEGDALSCLSDAGANADDLQSVGRALRSVAASWCGTDADVAGGASAAEKEMRGRYTMLFLAPGANVPVFPYESAFLSVFEGRSKVPTLFLSPVTLDVESQMRKAGVVPCDVRSEPADSVWNELAFLSYLYGVGAKRFAEGEGDGRPSDELATFLSEHGRKWLPAFMKAVIAESREAPAGDPYGALAHLGLVILSLTEFDTTEAL